MAFLAGGGYQLERLDPKGSSVISGALYGNTGHPGGPSYPFCPIVLGTFRKLADRVFFVHEPLALRERDRVRVGLLSGLKQFETFNPRPRSQPGNVRMGTAHH
jgi:hypothetical protein